MGRAPGSGKEKGGRAVVLAAGVIRSHAVRACGAVREGFPLCLGSAAWSCAALAPPPVRGRDPGVPWCPGSCVSWCPGWVSRGVPGRALRLPHPLPHPQTSLSPAGWSTRYSLIRAPSGTSPDPPPGPLEIFWNHFRKSPQIPLECLKEPKGFAHYAGPITGGGGVPPLGGLQLNPPAPSGGRGRVRSPGQLYCRNLPPPTPPPTGPAHSAGACAP